MTKEKISILKTLDTGKYNNHTFPNISPKIQKHIDTLFYSGYIEVPENAFYYKLTNKAYIAIDEYEEKIALQRKSDIKYWITTGIAVAAFVKSFFL